MTSYQEFVLQNVPSWLQKRWGKAFMQSLAKMFDDIHAKTIETSQARLPLYAPADALVYIGKERQIVRRPGESEDQYRSRLHRAWELWTNAGTDTALREVLEGYGCVDYDIYSVQTFPGGAPDGDDDWWSRFWVIITDPPFDPGSELATSLIAELKRWKASHALLEDVIFLRDGAVLWNYPERLWNTPSEDWTTNTADVETYEVHE